MSRGCYPLVWTGSTPAGFQEAFRAGECYTSLVHDYVDFCLRKFVRSTLRSLREEVKSGVGDQEGRYSRRASHVREDTGSCSGTIQPTSLHHPCSSNDSSATIIFNNSIALLWPTYCAATELVPLYVFYGYDIPVTLVNTHCRVSLTTKNLTSQAIHTNRMVCANKDIYSHQIDSTVVKTSALQPRTRMEG